MAARKFQRAEPLLVLLSTKHPDDCYGWERIDVLAWNVDGAGQALVRTYSKLGDEGDLNLLGADLPLILAGDDYGQRLYVQAPDRWDGKTLPDVVHSDDQVGDAGDHGWGHAWVDPTSDSALFRASHDDKPELLANRQQLETFDRCIGVLGLRPRGRAHPTCYGGCDASADLDRCICHAACEALGGNEEACGRWLRRAVELEPSLRVGEDAEVANEATAWQNRTRGQGEA